VKTKLSWIGLLAVLFASRLIAQPYSVAWYKVAGGGGASTGATYQVTGTIGQHDAGVPMSGGNYYVTGGFWGLISVVQTPGSPTLTVKVTGPNTIVVSWPSASTGFLLQQNSDLSTANWTTSGLSISDDGTNKSVTITSPAGNLFFRLKH
jgi:hypothetical protein